MRASVNVSAAACDYSHPVVFASMYNIAKLFFFIVFTQCRDCCARQADNSVYKWANRQCALLRWKRKHLAAFNSNMLLLFLLFWQSLCWNSFDHIKVWDFGIKLLFVCQGTYWTFLVRAYFRKIKFQIPIPYHHQFLRNFIQEKLLCCCLC